MVSLIITCINLYECMNKSVLKYPILKFSVFLKSEVCGVLQFEMKLSIYQPGESFCVFDFSWGGREEEPLGLSVTPM